MFEIYREGGYNRTYRVVYFTELGDHNKDNEISRALAGEHLFDGFLGGQSKLPGKKLIAAFVKRLNDGEQLTADDLSRELEPFLD
jgi:hypothetical protein